MLTIVECLKILNKVSDVDGPSFLFLHSFHHPWILMEFRTKPMKWKTSQSKLNTCKIGYRVRVYGCSLTFF